jgi:probable F420-dependent oxidoreductase
MEGLINPIPFFRPDDFLAMARLAEDLRYDSVWGNDHYAPQDYVRTTHGKAPNFYEVLTVLSSVAAATTRVELGTAVLVLPMRQPVVVAKQAVTLDLLSGGRLLLGVGIGAYREEYAAARPDLAGTNRGELLEEGVELLKLLSTEESVTYHGRFYRTEDLEMFPKPVRRPLQVLVGGHQQVTLDRAVAHGQGWIPGWRPFDELEEWIRLLRQKAEAAGRDPASLIVAPQLSCLVAATHEEATRRYVESGMVQHRKSLAYTGRDPELAMDNNLIGSAEAVLEKLDRLASAGVDHLACITFCVESREEYEEQVRFFAEEIMAPFRGALRP